MPDYRYLGQTSVQLVGYGIVYPKDVIRQDYINHPLFEEINKKPILEVEPKIKKITNKKRYT